MYVYIYICIYLSIYLLIYLFIYGSHKRLLRGKHIVAKSAAGQLKVWLKVGFEFGLAWVWLRIDSGLVKKVDLRLV